MELQIQILSFTADNEEKLLRTITWFPIYKYVYIYSIDLYIHSVCAYVFMYLYGTIYFAMPLTIYMYI